MIFTYVLLSETRFPSGTITPSAHLRKFVQTEKTITHSLMNLPARTNPTPDKASSAPATMTVEETSHGSLSAKTSLFMRIPVELKLHVLKAHTAFLHESAFVHVGKQARVTEAVGAFDEAGTPESISLRPDIQELILLHFPTAGRIMPTELFWTFMWNALITEDQELDTIGKRWKTLSMWHRRSAEVFQLRYLALVS